MQPSATVVLVVEDDPQVSEMLSAALEAEGYLAAVAADGAAALARLAAGDVDLMLLDVMLPDRDGIDVCRAVRAWRTEPFVPIIMLTTPTEQATRQAGLAAGANDYVTNPFDVDELLQRVRVWVGMGRQLRAAHAALREAQAALERRVAPRTAELAQANAAPQEVAERGAREALLRKLHHAIEWCPSIVMITDRDAVIEYVNPKFTEITGYTAAEVIGTPATALGEQAEADAQAKWEALAAGRAWRGEFRNWKKSGESYWELASISPVRDGSGAVTHYVKVAENVTAQRLLEERLRAAQQLEGVLLAARELTHRLNNALVPAVGLVELLQERVDLPAELRLLVVDAAASLDQAVEDVAKLQRVVRVETRQTPTGPALDLERSLLPLER